MALRILLADDSMTAQNMGKKILTDAGYEVVAVSNGAAAVKKIAEISPHLCILDIYMPGYTGLEVCEKIKASSATARMPVLLTVGKMEPYKPEEGARVRADGVIVKPFEASELLRAVHRFSQRIAGAQARPGAPVAAPPATSGTYERTVKLTREQIQEYMDPALQHWKDGTSPSEQVGVSSRLELPTEIRQAPTFSVEDLVANTKTASTADGMPAFTIHAALAEQLAPAAVAEAHEVPAMMDMDMIAPSPQATERSGKVSPEFGAAIAGIAEAPLRNASAVLPGFVDYLIQQEIAPANGTASTISLAGLATDTSAEVPAAPDGEFVVNPVQSEHTYASEPSAISIEPQLIHAVEGVHSTGAEVLSDELRDPEAVGYEVPVVDPALEVAPEVAVQVMPDPQFEAPQDLPVENATEEGLQPTSRSAESEGVVATTDPNLAPMDGLIDAVRPLEGGRFVVPQEEPQPVAAVAEVVLPETNAVAEPEAPPVSTPRKSKKSKDTAVVADTLPPSQESSAGLVAEPKPHPGDVTQEISAVLELLGQTTSAVIPSIPVDESVIANSVMMEPAPAVVTPGKRVWMAEEVTLSDSENSISLENEMRLAYTPKVADSAPEVQMTTTLAEEPVRDDKIAPKSAVPDTGGSPPGSETSPTEQLAAAMAAAFGGALPKEDLARAEETQSISEEVRRFALGDAYKPKPGFGGAAIEDPGEKTVNSEKLATAIGRVLDRLKPQLVSEILKELESMEEN